MIRVLPICLGKENKLKNQGAWAIITITKPGIKKALEIKEKSNEKELHIYTLTKYTTNGVYENDESLKEMVNRVYNSYETIIFIMSTGIVIRLIAPLIQSKTKDPGILVLDDRGRFVISLLSGHIGRANDNAKYLAEIIHASPVITTASDTGGKIAVDTFAQEHNLVIGNMELAKTITAMIVNDEKVAIVNESSIVLKENLINGKLPVIKIEGIKDYKGLIVVSSRKIIDIDNPYVQLIPRNIVVGIGCRKGIDGNNIIQFIEKKLEELGINSFSIKTLATVDVKRDEKGILDAVDYFNTDIKIIDRSEIETKEELFQGSEFVKETIGVSGVCEPCGYIASSAGRCLLNKTTYEGIALSIWEIKEENTYE